MKNRKRFETQKCQREAETAFHPRGLAREIVHNTLEREGATGLNKVDHARGITQSPFATRWRDTADYLFGK